MRSNADKLGVLAIAVALVLLSGGALALQLPVQAQAPMRVTIGGGPIPSLPYLPLSVAQALGYFEGQNLQVEIATFRGGSDTALALFGGQIQFSNMAIDHAFKSVDEGGPTAVMLATFLESMGLALVVHKDLADEVQSPADLKGKRIGVTRPGSGTHLLGIRIVRQAGLDPDRDVTFVGVGGTSTALAAMENREVDAVIHADPVVTLLVREGHRVLVDVRTPEVTRQIFGNVRTFTGLHALRSYIDANPEVVQAVVTAYAKAILWIAYHTPEEISQLLRDAGVADFDADIIAGSLPGLSPTGLTRQEGVETAIQALKEDGILSEGFSAPATQFYDNSFLREAAGTILGGGR